MWVYGLSVSQNVCVAVCCSCWGGGDAREADDSQGPPLGLGNIDLPRVKKNESTVSLRLLWSTSPQTPYPRARVCSPVFPAATSQPIPWEAELGEGEAMREC